MSKAACWRVATPLPVGPSLTVRMVKGDDGICWYRLNDLLKASGVSSASRYRREVGDTAVRLIRDGRRSPGVALYTTSKAFERWLHNPHRWSRVGTRGMATLTQLTSVRGIADKLRRPPAEARATQELVRAWNAPALPRRLISGSEYARAWDRKLKFEASGTPWDIIERERQQEGDN